VKNLVVSWVSKNPPAIGFLLFVL